MRKYWLEIHAIFVFVFLLGQQQRQIEFSSNSNDKSNSAAAAANQSAQMDARRQRKTRTRTSDKCYEESVYESPEEVLSVWKRKSVFGGGGEGRGEVYILGIYGVSTFLWKWGVFWNVFLYSKLHYA
jgi:hypothetical protein